MDDLKQINLSDEELTEGKESMTEDHDMQGSKKLKLIPTLIVIAVILGLGTGFFVAQKRLLLASGGKTVVAGVKDLNSSTKIKVGDVFGSADEQAFKDDAEGILVAGGIDGEGSHHIERGANKTQWVYVTSTVVDLDLIVGDRVKVWGETNQGKKAGWLMDIGRLKVLELNAAPADTGTAGND